MFLQLDAGYPGEHFGGQIVDSRAETAIDDHGVRSPGKVGQLCLELIRVVAQSHFALYDQPLLA